MSCRIMQVTQNLRQFNYGLGRDFFPGDLLFAPHESDIADHSRSTIRVTTTPHNGVEVEIPRERIAPTNFVAMESPILPPLGSARDRIRQPVAAVAAG